MSERKTYQHIDVDAVRALSDRFAASLRNHIHDTGARGVQARLLLAAGGALQVQVAEEINRGEDGDVVADGFCMAMSDILCNMVHSYEGCAVSIADSVLERIAGYMEMRLSSKAKPTFEGRVHVIGGSAQ